jgi:hypothetical protein
MTEECAGESMQSPWFAVKVKVELDVGPSGRQSSASERQGVQQVPLRLDSRWTDASAFVHQKNAFPELVLSSR